MRVKDFGFDLISFSSGLLQKHTVQDIMRCNERSARYGLVLTTEQAKELAETRESSLRENGRIEFGSGVVDKIINAFCDSPYLMQSNYVETLHELIELFYYYKSDVEDLISDDELIEFMKSSFDGECQGCIDLLANRELDQLARNLRNDRPVNYTDDEPDVDEEDEEVLSD
ncbi:MAG: hypothetical protein IKW76_03905, partial [Clostridia bacterium]|nr:hypothetical protein [Clostridia bacterium]